MQHYGLPTDLTKSELLERLCQLHPGTAPVIPILPHFTFDRLKGDRILLTRRTSATGPGEPVTSSSMRPLPATQLDLSQNKLSLYQPRYIEVQTTEFDTTAEPLRPSKSPSGHETPLREEPNLGKKKRQRGPLDIGHDLEVVARFPSPSDSYTPGPSPPPFRSPRSTRSSQHSTAPLPKRKMQFVYPPIPRPSPGHRTNAEGPVRAFSPGDSWLHKMYVDLERGRTELLGDLEEAKREVREALDEVTRADLAMKREVAEMKEFIAWLEKVVSTEWTNSIIATATRRAEEGTSDSGFSGSGDDDDEPDGGDDNVRSDRVRSNEPEDSAKPKSPRASLPPSDSCKASDKPGDGKTYGLSPCPPSDAPSPTRENRIEDEPRISQETRNSVP